MISGYMKPQILFRTNSEARSETRELVREKRRETTQHDMMDANTGGISCLNTVD